MSAAILVSEVFGPVLQGEGALTGSQTVFVRTGGCDFRCTWCDSGHAVDPIHKPEWKPQTPAEVMNEVLRLSDHYPTLITLSGGNPALQPLEEFIDLAHEFKCPVAMETQGSIAKPWFYKLDHLILSPKPPSSLMKFKAANLRSCIQTALTGRGWSNPLSNRLWPELSLKVVVMDEDDYQFAHRIYADFARPWKIPFFITPGNHTPPTFLIKGKEVVNKDAFDLAGIIKRTEWILKRCAEDGFMEARIIPQLHTFLFGNERAR